MNVTSPGSGREHLESRTWADDAVRRIEADANRSADTHLHSVSAALPVGHRSVPEGRVGPPDGIAQASTRALAVPVRPVQRLDHRGDDDRRGLERLDGRLRGVLRALPRPAVRRGHAGLDQPREDRADRGQGGDVPPGRRRDDRWTTRRTGSRPSADGHFLDQFTYAERATDWRGNNNIAESIFSQMALERHPVPTWIVVGAGTGGTSATIGRYAALRALPDAAVRRRPGGLDLLLGLDAATPRRSPAGRRASRASDGSASSRRSCRASSTA